MHRIKILHVSYSDDIGGAAVAALRHHTCMLKAGYRSTFLCLRNRTNSPQVIGVSSTFQHHLNSLKNRINQGILRIVGVKEPQAVSLNVWDSPFLKLINDMDCDVVVLHWVNAELLSCRDISRIRHKLIWVFHDLWPICGIRAYPNVGLFEQTALNKVTDLIDQWSRRRKKKSWKDLDVHIVAVSQWVKDQVDQSNLFNEATVSVIYNPIPIQIFYPRNRIEVRKKFKIPEQKKVILFGAPNLNVFRKGGDLLVKALENLPDDLKKEVLLVTFGRGGVSSDAFATLDVGSIHDEEHIAELYSMADVMCVPSRMETFGQTALEAQACGTPVVAFNTSGLPEVVSHLKTGYLASAFDARNFALGIEWVLEQPRSEIESRCLTQVSRFSFDTIGRHWENLLDCFE